MVKREPATPENVQAHYHKTGNYSETGQYFGIPRWVVKNRIKQAVELFDRDHPRNQRRINK